jgi:hypothetical protein
LNKYDCRTKYVRKGICDSRVTTLKSQYWPKDDAYKDLIVQEHYSMSFFCWRLNENYMGIDKYFNKAFVIRLKTYLHFFGGQKKLMTL